MLPSMWPSEFLEWDKELSMYMHWKHIAHTHVLVHGEPQIRPFGGLQSKVKAYFISMVKTLPQSPRCIHHVLHTNVVDQEVAWSDCCRM